MSTHGDEPRGRTRWLERLTGDGPVRLWTVLGGMAGVFAALITVGALLFSGNSTPSPSPASTPPPSASPTPVSSVDGSSASESTPSSGPASSPTVEGVQYLDDYAQRCEVGGSIQRTGPATINGTAYSHAISQTPNGYAGTAFYLARHAHRFQAIVGPTDDAAQGDRMQFELVTETGSTLFTSSVLSVGQTQPVDLSVEGVLRLFLVAKLVGQGVGAQGTAGWGDPQVAAAELTCP